MSEMVSRARLIVPVLELNSDSNTNKTNALSVFQEILGDTGLDADYFEGEVEYFEYDPEKTGGYSAIRDLESGAYALAYDLPNDSDDDGCGYVDSFITVFNLLNFIEKMNEKIKQAGYASGLAKIHVYNYYNGSDEPIRVS